MTEERQPTMRLLLAARKSNKLRDREGHQHLSVSIEIQDKQAKDWAEREGHTVVAVTADIKSGTVAPWDRPKLRPWVTKPELMAQYDGILAYKNDRLSRGCWADETRIRLWAEEHGKALIIVDGPQWPPRHDGDFWQWTAMANQARKEWEDIQRRNTETQAELRARGALIGRPPFGYTTAGDTYARYLTPTDEGLLIVPQIYARVIRGDSLPAIAAWLDAEGVRPTSGTKWWAKSLGELIHNPTYRGQRCEQDPKTKRYGRMLHECEPIVDAAIWKQANDNLDARPKRGKVFAANRAMLSGAIFCPVCDDSPMYRIKAGNQNRHLYYRCSGRGPQRKGCGLMVQAAKVDAAVDEVFSALKREDRKLEITPGHDHEAELKALDYDKQQVTMRGLSRAEERAEMDRIWAEIERVEGLPVVEEKHEWKLTGEPYCDIWAKLTTPERGAWLVAKGFQITASKTEVRIGRGDDDWTVTVAI